MSASTTPRYVGPLILGSAALLLIAVIVTVFVTRQEKAKPSLSDFPVPEGAVVRFAREDCVDDRCTATLAVGPHDNVELPRPAEVMLGEHLVDAGWQRRGDDTYVGPTGDTAHLTGFGDAPTATRERIRLRLKDFVDADELAVVTLEPAG